jgi:cell division protein YceG involved in septum cleavage
MSNNEYMAIARKLSENDNRKNLISGLVITIIVVVGISYLQYQKLKSQKEKIEEKNKENFRISQDKARMIYEKFRLQGIIDQLKKNNELLKKKLQENDIQKNNA